MKERLLLFSLIICCCLCSCTQRNDTDGITIDATSHDFTQWNEILDFADTIPLQQTGESVLSNVDNMILCPGGFLLTDVKTGKIFKFASDGRLVYSTGELGRANNEYLRPLDICLSNDGQNFVLLDESGLLYYRLNDGKFVKKEKIFNNNQYWNKFMIDKAGNIFGFSPYAEHTILLRATGGEVKNLRDYKSYQLITRKFYKYNNVVHVLPDWGDYTIDYYSKGRLKTKYRLDFGSDIIPSNWVPTTSKDFTEKDYKSENLFRTVFDACESDKYLCALVVGPGQTNYLVIYNKATGKTYAGKASGSYCAQFVGAEGDFVYVLVYPSMIKDNSYLLEFCKRLDSDGNQNPFVLKLRINPSGQ